MKVCSRKENDRGKSKVTGRKEGRRENWKHEILLSDSS
jgi:hypothetical protein